MDFVIDVQGFRGKEGNFLPKEIALIALHHTYIVHWIIAPPYTFNNLHSKYRRQNNWLSRHHHGIEWHEGSSRFIDVVDTLRSVTRNAGRIFTRGREKAEFLMEVTSREIINLEDDERCPALKRLVSSTLRCAPHATKRNQKLVCALNFAASLKAWILFHIEDEKEEDGQSPDSEGSTATSWGGFHDCSSSGHGAESVAETDGSSD